MIEQFCNSILQQKIPQTKALANLIMGLASQTNAKSVVEVSESPCYHYQYSSISKVITALVGKKTALKNTEESKVNAKAIKDSFLKIKSDNLPNCQDNFWLMNTDMSPLFRRYSPTLPNRGYVYKPNNQIKGNKPVDIGYEFSCVGLSCRQGRYGVSEPTWNLPLSMELVPSEENKNLFTAKQVNEILENKNFPFHKELTVNSLDSNYSSPEYIATTYHQPCLVNIIRLASNRNVWDQQSEEEQKERRNSNEDNRGANSVYGQKYSLNQEPNWDKSCDDKIEFCIKIGKRKYVVEVREWKNMMIRTKRKLSMKDKSCRLIAVRLLDEEGNPIFKNTLWLSVWGERNGELSLEEIFWAYRLRFDIEHFFRFGKQRLLLDKFETPIEAHMGIWLEVVALAYWTLWVGRESAKYECPKWQQYDKNRKKRAEYNLLASPSEVQRELERIILSFEQKPFIPKLRKKGTGRKEGMKLPKRNKYPVIKKAKKAANCSKLQI